MSTQLIGILNITPDSFSDGGKYNKVEHALAQAEKLVQNGAEILDIGAESTRPGATILSHQEEWQRLEPLLHPLLRLSVPLSIDTYHPETAAKAIAMGVSIINDVSGCKEEAMQEVIAASQASVIIMHNMGIPADKNIIIPPGKDPVLEVYQWAEERLEQLSKKGIAKERVIIDPGIGFGKNAKQSLLLLQSVAMLKPLGATLCVGHSRKSFLAAFSTHEAQNRDIETIAASLYLTMQGVDYLRVHDVLGHRRALSVFRALYSDGKG